KTVHLDLAAVLKPAWQVRPVAATYRVSQRDHKLYIRLDNKFVDESEPALTKGLHVRVDCDVTNTDRSLGTSLSYRISKLYGEECLHKDMIHIRMKSSTGQLTLDTGFEGCSSRRETHQGDYQRGALDTTYRSSRRI